MENLVLLSSVSVFSAAICIAIGASSTAIGEGGIAKNAMLAIAQQPDESGEISRTCFITMSIVESSAIYCFVVAMILIFANPFWNTLIQKI